MRSCHASRKIATVLSSLTRERVNVKAGNDFSISLHSYGGGIFGGLATLSTLSSSSPSISTTLDVKSTQEGAQGSRFHFHAL